MTNFRALCVELTDALDKLNCSFNVPNQSGLVERASAALAEPEPEGPTDEELKKLLYFEFTQSTGHGHSEDPIGFARAVLARWGQPTPQPISVIKRRPGPEDCDAEGRCWFGKPLRPIGIYSMYWSWDLKHRHSSLAQQELYWLPASVRQLPVWISSSRGNNFDA